MSTSDWFKIKEVENDIFIVEEPGYVQSYLVNGTTHSALLDTGMGIQNISAAIKPLVRESVSVFNTHWHFDHTGIISTGSIFSSNLPGPKAFKFLSIFQRIPANDASSSVYPGPFARRQDKGCYF